MTASIPVNFKHAKDIHPDLELPLLDELVRPERSSWSKEELRELTSVVTEQLTLPLHGILRFDSRQRWWSRLALTMGVELWLLSWAPGQGTEPHDHGGASGSFTVLLGELDEQFLFPGGPIESAERRAGATVAFGADRAHQLRNHSGRPAASVHAYSPPLRPMREYRALTDFAGA